MDARMRHFFDDDVAPAAVAPAKTPDERKINATPASTAKPPLAAPESRVPALQSKPLHKTDAKPLHKTIAKPIHKPDLSMKEEFSAAVRDVRALVFEGEGSAGKHKKAPQKKAIRQYVAAKTTALGAKLDKGVGHGWKHRKEMLAARKRKMEAASQDGVDQVTASRMWLEPQEAQRNKTRQFKAKKEREGAAKLTQLGKVPRKFLVKK